MGYPIANCQYFVHGQPERDVIIAPNHRLRAKQRIDDRLFHGFHHRAEQSIDDGRFRDQHRAGPGQLTGFVFNPIGRAESDDKITAAA